MWISWYCVAYWCLSEVYAGYSTPDTGSDVVQRIGKLSNGRICSHDFRLKSAKVSYPIPTISLQQKFYYPGTTMNGGDTITGTFPTKTFTLLNCDGFRDTMFASLKPSRSEITIPWITPSSLSSPVVFVATIIGKNGEVWENVTSVSFKKGFFGIDFSSCGISKGCFRYSNDGKPCNAHDCEYAVTYKEVKGYAEFEMTAMSSWMAIGFSSDRRMGGDDVLMCLNNYNDLTASHYVTEYNHIAPRQIVSNIISNIQVIAQYARKVKSTTSGRISCRFRRLMKIHDDSTSVDLNNVWFQFYAWGRITSGGALQRHVLPSPPISEYKIALSNTYNVISSANVQITNISVKLIVFILICRHSLE